MYQWTNVVMCIERIKATWCPKHKKSIVICTKMMLWYCYSLCLIYVRTLNIWLPYCQMARLNYWAKTHEEDGFIFLLFIRWMKWPLIMKIFVHWFVLERRLNGQRQHPGRTQIRHDKSRIEWWRVNPYKYKNTLKII